MVVADSVVVVCATVDVGSTVLPVVASVIGSDVMVGRVVVAAKSYAFKFFNIITIFKHSAIPEMLVYVA